MGLDLLNEIFWRYIFKVNIYNQCNNRRNQKHKTPRNNVEQQPEIEKAFLGEKGLLWPPTHPQGQSDGGRRKNQGYKSNTNNTKQGVEAARRK